MAHQGLSLTFSEQRLCKNETDSGMAEGLYSRLPVLLVRSTVLESIEESDDVTDNIFLRDTVSNRSGAGDAQKMFRKTCGAGEVILKNNYLTSQSCLSCTDRSHQ